MPKVDELTLQGYKSIKLLSLQLNDVNILIGANGAGKSNFISAFKLLNEMYHKRLQFYTQNKSPDSFLHFGKKHTEKIYFQFKFALNAYSFTLFANAENKLMIEKEEVVFDGPYFGLKRETIGENLEEANISEAKKISYKAMIPYLKSIDKWKIYHFHDTSDTSKMKGKSASNDNLVFKQDASNLAPYLKMLCDKHKEYYEQIVASIQIVAPFFGGFIFRDEEYIQLEWFDKMDRDTPFKAHHLSDGTLRFIALATLFLQPFDLMPDTIIVDEPELGLHPFALAVLSELIKGVGGKKQVIISSQSVELINYFEPQDIIVVDKEDNQSVFKRLDFDDLKTWLEEYSLGELWNKNIIGGRPK